MKVFILVSCHAGPVIIIIPDISCKKSSRSIALTRPIDQREVLRIPRPSCQGLHCHLILFQFDCHRKTLVLHQTKIVDAAD